MNQKHMFSPKNNDRELSSTKLCGVKRQRGHQGISDIYLLWKLAAESGAGAKAAGNVFGDFSFLCDSTISRGSSQRAWYRIVVLVGQQWQTVVVTAESTGPLSLLIYSGLAIEPFWRANFKSERESLMDFWGKAQTTFEVLSDYATDVCVDI